MSQELYGTSDSLVFDMIDECWGDFKESGCQVDMNICPFMKLYENSIENNVDKVLHSGSCLMYFEQHCHSIVPLGRVGEDGPCGRL